MNKSHSTNYYPFPRNKSRDDRYITLINLQSASQGRAVTYRLYDLICVVIKKLLPKFWDRKDQWWGWERFRLKMYTRILNQKLISIRLANGRSNLGVRVETRGLPSSAKMSATYSPALTVRFSWIARIAVGPHSSSYFNGSSNSPSSARKGYFWTRIR